MYSKHSSRIHSVQALGMHRRPNNNSNNSSMHNIFNWMCYNRKRLCLNTLSMLNIHSIIRMYRLNRIRWSMYF